MEDLDQFVDSYENSFPYARDNHGVLTAYARELVGACHRFDRKIDICSLGIGYEIVSRKIALELAGKIASYTAVEGSKLLVERYKKNVDFQCEFNLIHSYFENFESSRLFDVIEMGFVLEHVNDPADIINRFSELLKPDGIICAAVPNALSLHRVLGFRAGMLKDPYQLNEWDLKLGHKRYFDTNSFRNIFVNEGLSITRETGLMLKPLATSQMDMLNLPEAVWDVFFNSGDLAPAYAYSLYLEACLPGDGKA